MKKMILTASLVLVAGSAFPAGTSFPANGAAVTGGTGNDCSLIKESVIPRSSANVSGAYDCNTTTGYIGIGTASSAGANFQFEAGNKGGTMAKTPCASAATNYVTCAQTAASNASST